MGIARVAEVVGGSEKLEHRGTSVQLLSNLAVCIMPGMAPKKNPNAVALGRLGGKARAANLSDAERSQIASKAGKARSEKLSSAERRRIALLAVQARERKRKQSKRRKGERQR